MLCLFFFANGFTVGQKLEKLPLATHFEVGLQCSQLVKIKEISSNYDDDVLLARPTALTVDSEKNLYIYDNMLVKISKFDKNYRLISSFMRSGRGPGESAGGMTAEGGTHKIYYAHDSNLYVSDPLNNKVIVYSPTDGKHLKDIKLDKYGRDPFNPVVDSRGHLYALNNTGGIIDELDLNNKMTLIHTYLDGRLSNNCLIFKRKYAEVLPKDVLKRMSYRPELSDVGYDVYRDNQLIVFLFNPSTLFIFKDQKLMLERNIYIQSVMDNYRKVAVKFLDGQKRIPHERKKFMGFSPMTMFITFFVDKDDDRFFYLTEFYENLNVYMFNQRGDLIKVLSYPTCYPDKQVFLYAKRNNLFYGLIGVDRNPIIFMEEKKKKEEKKR